jgi:hypothetical protein
MCDVCGQGWRIEATHLSTGIVKAVLHPVSGEWEEPYSRPGTASLKASVVGPSIDDIWAHTTGLYNSRVVTDAQGQPARYCRFGGFVEAAKPDLERPGLFDIGAPAIDWYPFHRLLVNENEGIEYSTPGYESEDVPGDGLSQTEIAKALLEIAVTGKGYIPLIPVAEPSEFLRVRHWDPWEFKNLGEAVKELTEDPDGLRYGLTHQYFENPNRWVSTITFTDEQNTDRGVVLRGGFEGWQYGMEIDGKDQASRIYGVGSGEGEGQMFSVAYDEDADLPEFQKTMAWKDVKVPETLDEYTRGAVTKYRDPATTPTLTLIGLDDVPPESLLSGDIVSCDIGYGLATFRDQQARVESQTWRLQTDQPVTRTLALDPVIRPSLSVKTQTPAKEPVPETPEEETDPPPQTPIEVPAPQYPSQVFDLTNWKLTLPIGSSGDPDEIKQPGLGTYSSEFFHTVAGPGVLFKAPQNGVTTPNSKNTRSELREMKNGGKDNASWSTGTMEAVLAFTHLPSSKPHVVGMQIHDSDDDVSVLRLEGTDLWTTNGDNTHGTKIMSGYQLGTFIKVKVVAGGGSIKWYLNDVEVASLSKSISGGYFKAGAYQQAGNSGSDYGEVVIRSLVVTH